MIDIVSDAKISAKEKYLQYSNKSQIDDTNEDSDYDEKIHDNKENRGNEDDDNGRNNSNSNTDDSYNDNTYNDDSDTSLHQNIVILLHQLQDQKHQDHLLKPHCYPIASSHQLASSKFCTKTPKAPYCCIDCHEIYCHNPNNLILSSIIVLH